jgi:hypothetical protein
VSQGEERTLDRRSPPSTYRGQPRRGDRKGCIRVAARQPRPARQIGTAGPARGARPGVPPPSGTGPQAARPDGGRAEGRGYGGAPRRRLIPTRPFRQPELVAVVQPELIVNTRV